MIIKPANLENIEELVPLFDAYRVFYQQPSDLERSRSFIKERLIKNDSVIFMALLKDKVVGFTQLYPTFSSVSTQQYYILNDLYVQSKNRNQGVAKALLKHAQQYVTEKGLKGLSLETATDNPAQFLYEKLGWKKDENYLHYFWEVKSS